MLLRLLRSRWRVDASDRSIRAIFAQRIEKVKLGVTSRLYPFREQTLWNFRVGTIVSRKREAKHERKR
jgi:hypothetical protein